MKTRKRSWLGWVLLLLTLGAHAQSTDGVEPYEEFGKHLRAAQEVSPLKSNLFGDQVSLYNGATEFDVTDIDLPGNSGLPVRFGRRLTIDDRRWPTGRLAGLGDWDLDVPYINGVFTQQNGWVVLGSDYKTPSAARCTITHVPYTGPSNMPPVIQVWDGNQLHIPGEGGGELLSNTEAKLPANTDGKSYPWITKDYDLASCLPSTANGYPGEAFSVLTPSGVSYTFNWAAVIPTSTLLYQVPVPSPNPGGKSYKASATRSRIYLLATRVEDRFGNWVTYTWNGNHLTQILANDGREIDIHWTGDLVTSATAGSRTWTYGYGVDGNLSSVTRPDGSQWKYQTVSGSLKTVQNHDNSPPPTVHCQLTPDPNTGAVVYAMDAPSGAHGVFTFQYARHFRTYVPYSCTNYNPNTAYAEIYDFFDNFTLTSKQITGAGLSAQNWTYDYGSNHGGYFTPSIPASTNEGEDYMPPGDCSTCDTTKVVTVTSSGDITKYTFGIEYARDEGRLLSTEVDAPNGAALRTVSNTYLDDSQISTQPFPHNAGISVQSLPKNPMVGRIRPLVMTSTTQDGDTYTHQNLAFDAFAQPTLVKRYNSIAGEPSITEQTTYFNDLQHWVLGLPQQVDNLTNGETESHNTYAPATALLQASSHFGQTQLTYTYNAQGQLASFTDGDSHTTGLSNYYRGIPRLINYPDSTSQSATVSDYGEITAVTDQAGHTTRYQYDAVGWPTEIDYPTGDEQNWLPKTFQFAYVTSAEKGIAGGHWRRTVATGNNIDVTYFDAMLRPLLSDTYISGTAGSDIITVAGFDWRGLTTFASYPVSTATSLASVTLGTNTTYDVLGRSIRVVQNSELGVDPASTTQYLSGARVQVTDPKGNATTSTYQVFDEPSTQAVIKVQAPEGITQTIARDLYGNPTSITQSGTYGTETDSVAKQLYYDSYHRLCRTTEPESGSTLTNYDNANNVRSTASGLAVSGTACGSAQASALTTFSYDALNRVETILPPAGTQSTSYHYTPTGNVDQTQSGNSLWGAHYNARDMMTDETLTLTGQDPMTLGYAHNVYGALDHLTYPDGESVSYAPDAFGRPTQASGYAHGVEYFPSGQVSGFLYGDGTGYVAEQNTRQLLKSFTYGTGSTLTLSENLGYDPNGNILTVQDGVGNKRSKTFGYDGLNRLTSAVAPQLWGTESYTYDPLNNLRTRLTGGQTNVYTYDPTNRLTSIVRLGSAIASFGYDNRGNETSKNGNTLLFDQKDQLTQISGFDSYQYDAAGRRTVKTPVSGVGATYTFYDHAGQLLYQYEPGISKSTNFIYLGSHLVADKEHLKLSAPGAVSFSANPNNGSYTVSWGAVSNATSYVLQEQVNGASWTTVYGGAAPSTTLSGRAGGSYVYQVKACSGSACGPWSLSATLGVRPALPVVSVPSGTVNGAYTVSWTAPASATGYQVQERLNGGAWTTIATTPGTSISRPGTTSGSYTYQVAASNSYGTRGWASSGAVKVDTNYGVLPPPPASLAVPGASNNGSATLSWAATTPTTSYTLQQSGNGGASWANSYQGVATSAAVAGLPDGHYSYRVQSCNTYGCSTWRAGSAALVVTHPPTAAPYLNATPNSTNGSYTVTWVGVGGALSYQLQEQVNGGGWSTVQNTAATQWSASGRATGTYGHRVQACNAGGCGPWSATASLSVLLPPPTPASISIPASSNGPVTVSWAASPTATSYTLQHADYNVTGWSTIYNGGATSQSRNETTTGTWIYQVTACNASGCSTFRVSSGGVLVTIAPNSAPSLSVPAISANGSYTISWSAVNAATAYTLQEQINGGAWNTSQNSSATSKAFSGKGSGHYGYRVQGCNAGGCGPWSAVGTIAVAQPPAAPSVTAPAYVHGTPYTVNWSAPSGSTSYKVRRTLSSTGASSIIATTASTYVGIAAPVSSQTLQYAVQACNANGCSGFANAPNTTYTDRAGAPQIVTSVPPQEGGTP